MVFNFLTLHIFGKLVISLSLSLYLSRILLTSSNIIEIYTLVFKKYLDGLHSIYTSYLSFLSHEETFTG